MFRKAREHELSSLPKARQARRQFLQVGLACMILPLTSRADSREAHLVAVRIWPAGEYTRVTLESNVALNYRSFSLTNPDRLVLDLDGIEWNSELDQLSGKASPDDPYLEQIRAGRNKPGTVRVVMALKMLVKPQVFSLPPVAEYGHRLVIDLYPEHAADPLMALLSDKANSGPAAASTLPATPSSKPSASARPITIMLDPGHGGEDPGAIGHAGSYEKTVVLAIGKRLKALINAQDNLQAAMTRDADFFVPLAERVKKARSIHADLFISIHADAFLTPTARGSSVFALSENGATSTAAKWLARSQNDADLVGGVSIGKGDANLRRTLFDLTQTATLSDSLKLGRTVLGELSAINGLHKSDVEQAGFAVLKAPDIPSILIETAFISNPEEEARLNDEDYQDKMARAILAGIQHHFTANANGLLT